MSEQIIDACSLCGCVDKNERAVNYKCPSCLVCWHTFHRAPKAELDARKTVTDAEIKAAAHELYNDDNYGNHVAFDDWFNDDTKWHIKSALLAAKKARGDL